MMESCCILIYDHIEDIITQGRPGHGLLKGAV